MIPYFDWTCSEETREANRSPEFNRIADKTQEILAQSLTAAGLLSGDAAETQRGLWGAELHLERMSFPRTGWRGTGPARILLRIAAWVRHLFEGGLREQAEAIIMAARVAAGWIEATPEAPAEAEEPQAETAE